MWNFSRHRRAALQTCAWRRRSCDLEDRAPSLHRQEPGCAALDLGGESTGETYSIRIVIPGADVLTMRKFTKWCTIAAGDEKLTLSKIETPGCELGLKKPGVQPLFTVPRWSLSSAWTVQRDERWCRRWESNPHDLAVTGF
jgi:hypothetical protein